jgi:hypothetical protein
MELKPSPLGVALKKLQITDVHTYPNDDISYIRNGECIQFNAPRAIREAARDEMVELEGAAGHVNSQPVSIGDGRIHRFLAVKHACGEL